ncbi:hypothetical protein [Halocatena halophila]|uniref:hypothetical protein n=1 Tax=Halocatena halophila TaxID=2814576 RepID=UPI002ED39B93
MDNAKIDGPLRLSRRALLGTVAGVVGTTGGCLSLAGYTDPSPMGFVASSASVGHSQDAVVVRTEAELRDAVGQDGTSVWLPGELELELSGPFPIAIAPNVTIASDRGQQNPGAKLSVSSYPDTVFEHTEGHCRVSGVRFRGPELDFFDPRTAQGTPASYYTQAFDFKGELAEIDHCELAGWTHAAISGGAADVPTTTRVHHNAIHHNQMQTLGYGVNLRNGEGRIEWNYFDYNRHSVAAFGSETNGYEARYNVVGPHAVSHVFDMHSKADNLDDYSGNLAGTHLRVHHNVVEPTTVPGVGLRGVSTEQSFVRNNWFRAVPSLSFSGKESIIFQSKVDTNQRFDVRANEYGPRATDRGRDWLRQRAGANTNTRSSVLSLAVQE